MLACDLSDRVISYDAELRFLSAYLFNMFLGTSQHLYSHVLITTPSITNSQDIELNNGIARECEIYRAGIQKLH